MTGFGSAARTWSRSDGPTHVELEARSVNSRFLELKIRQPFGVAGEQALRKVFESALGRGRVDVSVALRKAGDDDEGLTLDPGSLNATLQGIARVRAEAGRAGVEVLEPNALEILRFVLSNANRSGTAELQPEPPPFLSELAAEALQGLLAFRSTEGEALTEAVTQLLDELEHAIDRLRQTLPGEQARLHERMTERLVSLCGAAQVELPDATRVAQEIALLVARGDIEEEIARIGSHLAQMRETVASKPSKGQGKRLDFLTQELLREVTTIGSKITSHDGSRLVIEAKGAIERIREQVQNVE